MAKYSNYAFDLSLNHPIDLRMHKCSNQTLCQNCNNGTNGFVNIWQNEAMNVNSNYFSDQPRYVSPITNQPIDLLLDKS